MRTCVKQAMMAALTSLKDLDLINSVKLHFFFALFSLHGLKTGEMEAFMYKRSIKATSMSISLTFLNFRNGNLAFAHVVPFHLLNPAYTYYHSDIWGK